MVEAFFRFLITIVIIAMFYFLGIWVLGELGIVIPHMVLVCLMILAVLFICLLAWRFFGGFLSAGPWFGPPPPPRA